MRGEWAEFNPWQVPMSQAVEPVLDRHGREGLSRRQRRRGRPTPRRRPPDLAFGGDLAVAVLLSQKMIGRKVWVK
jgi:hypothetical protein